MGALIVASLTLIFGAMLATELPWQFKAAAFAIYAAGLAIVGAWTAVMTFKHPRHFAYGPSELLEQNRIEYEHNLAMRKLELEHRGK